MDMCEKQAERFVFSFYTHTQLCGRSAAVTLELFSWFRFYTHARTTSYHLGDDRAEMFVVDVRIRLTKRPGACRLRNVTPDLLDGQLRAV